MKFKIPPAKAFATHLLYILAVLGILVFTVFGDSGLYRLHIMYKSEEKLNHQIRENQNKITHLESEKKRLANPDYLEGIIRDELGYIKDRELVFQITADKEKAEAAETTEAEAEAETQRRKK